MEQLKKALDYFIEYEWVERLYNLTLNEKEHINITCEEAGDMSALQKRLFFKKKEQLRNIIEKIIFKKPERSGQVIQELEKILAAGDRGERTIEDILFEEDYKYPENYPYDVTQIDKILKDNQMLILYPILANGKKKIPLICFEVEISDRSLKVQSYQLQMEALRIMVAAIIGCEIPEVDIYMNDFKNFYESLTVLENPNFFEIVDIIDTELKAKFSEIDFESIWKYKNFNQWAITEEIILTMEAFDDVMFLPFQEEIQEVRRQCEEKSFPILEKYLFGSNKRCMAKEKQVVFYDGSYFSDFSINEKQAKIISAYQESQLLSVNGPPGTGKTTVLKEVIADNIVKKVKELLDVWDEPWNEVGVGNQKVYESPFSGACNYSMVIASSNNKAVDNIGKELLKEIDYFSDAVCPNEKGYKGTLCARLGKKDNMMEFRTVILNPLIDFLNNDLYDEDNARSCIEEFKRVERELEEYQRANSQYLSLREQICEQLMGLGVFKGRIQEEEIVNVLKNVKEDILRLEKMKQESKEQLDWSQKLRDSKSQVIFELDDRLKILNNTLREKQSQLQEIQKKSQYCIIGKIMVWSAEKRYGSQEKINENIKEILNDIGFASQVKCQNMEDYAKAEEACKRQKKIIEECEKKRIEDEEQKRILERWTELKEKFQMLTKLYQDGLQWDDPIYKFNVCTEITKKRNRIFLLSLKITEWYIKKYTLEIRYNLKKVYPDSWFQAFYRRNYHYDEKYIRYLKAVWETIFLCFPVVTTTLHAFDRKKFPMVPEIFDTLLIDEAGQALIHTAIGPLLRFRREIIVGDVFQLEPIRVTQEQSILDKVELPIEVKESIDINRNSIQHAADRGSEIFDLMNEQEVGIVLEEHRRCESSIVQFSNQYVYDKCLKIVKEDGEKEFLEKNFCMLDIRGAKTRANENISEVEACAKIVESLVEIYGSEYKRKIGIITPYRNQSQLLKEKLPEIDSGTVHIFQGQEKEVILMSMVIDNTQRNSGIFFIGNKPNFLNVAFTRAKKQLILVGNYEACNMSGNYLAQAMECLRKYGRLYSLYEPEIMETEAINEKYLRQFWNIMLNNRKEETKYKEVIRKHVLNGMIVGPKEHHGFLEDILSCVPQSIKIVSPWITANVVDKEFLERMRAMREKHNTVKICFGYNKTNYTLDQIEEIVERDNFGNQKEYHKKAIEELRHILKDDLKYCPPLHSKILIVDNEFMVIGSHNWLSNRGRQVSAKDEMGCLIYDESAIEFVNNRYGLNDN